MSEALLQSAKKPPAGWRVTLICQPGKPSRICLHWTMPDGGYLQHQVTLAHARFTTTALRGALTYLAYWHPQDASYMAGVSPVCVFCAGRKGRKPIGLSFSANYYPLEVHTADYKLTPEAAGRFADSIDELLALLDAPRCELTQMGVDANPERNLPGYVAPHRTPEFIPEFLRSVPTAVEALS